MAWAAFEEQQGTERTDKCLCEYTEIYEENLHYYRMSLEKLWYCYGTVWIPTYKKTALCA